MSLMDYKAYLRSEKWKRIRRAVLRRDKRRCRSCGRRASQVHHGSYDPETMRGARLDKLYAICGKCHEAVSRDIFGFKREMKEQQEWTKALGPGERVRKKKSPRRGRLSIGAIRALSMEYAEGRMK